MNVQQICPRRPTIEDESGMILEGNTQDGNISMLTVQQVCARGSTISRDRGTSPHLLLPPFFPSLTDDEEEASNGFQDDLPELEVENKPKFPPWFWETQVDKKIPISYCSILQHLCDEGIHMLWGLSFLTHDALYLFDEKVQTLEMAKIEQLEARDLAKAEALEISQTEQQEAPDMTKIGQQEPPEMPNLAQHGVLEIPEAQTVEMPKTGQQAPLHIPKAPTLEMAESGQQGTLEMAKIGHRGTLEMAKIGHQGTLEMAKIGQQGTLDTGNAEALEIATSGQEETTEMAKTGQQCTLETAQAEQEEEEKEEKICYEVLRALCKHKEIIFQWEKALESEEAEDIEEAEKKLSASAWVLAKLFAWHTRLADKFQTLGGSQLGAVIFFQKIFKKFRMLMLKRLGTSQEQEESLADYRKEMYRRETKAIKDHRSLEQKLELDRVQRAKHFAQYEESERKIEHDKQQSSAHTRALEQQLKADCEALARQEHAMFSAEEKVLSEQNATMNSLLVKMQNDNRDKELSLRGKKSQSVEEVEALLEDYEQAITSRKAELGALCEEHKEMKARIHTYQGFFDEEARVAFAKAEAERIAWEKICERFLFRKRYYHAARKIQRAWRKHVAYESKKKKNQGKGGRKKGKKGKKPKSVEDLMPKRPGAKKGGRSKK